MNPSISNISEEGSIYRFTLGGINVSFANAIRRTILSDIPITAIETETESVNKCTIHANTGRLHNEILKQRLSSIPIHVKDLDELPGKYVLEVDVTNDSENIMYVTTEHFRIQNKESGNYLTKEKTREIFPPCEITGSYIDFARLRPQMGGGLPGEQLKLTAEFSVSNAKVNSMYNVVSKCAYGNTPDKAKIAEVWEEQDAKLRSEGVPAEDIAFQKKNFEILDAQRHFIADSFDFVVQTIGIYDNRELVYKACAILQNKIIDMIQSLDSDTVAIIASQTTMDHCFDVFLDNEDYTIGKVLEYILYEKHYMGDNTLSFCGFKKFHPHDTDARIRIAFDKKGDKTNVKQYLRDACVDAQELFKVVYKMFK